VHGQTSESGVTVRLQRFISSFSYICLLLGWMPEPLSKYNKKLVSQSRRLGLGWQGIHISPKQVSIARFFEMLFLRDSQVAYDPSSS
jgi:hypothetical protein